MLSKYSLVSTENIREMVQEVLIVLVASINRGNRFDETRIPKSWVRRVVKGKVMRFYLRSRDISEGDAVFYFTMRKRLGDKFTTEDLMAFDPALSQAATEYHFRRYHEIKTLLQRPLFSLDLNGEIDFGNDEK